MAGVSYARAFAVLVSRVPVKRAQWSQEKNGYHVFYLSMNFRDLWLRSIVNITSNSYKYSDLGNETSTVRDVSA